MTITITLSNHPQGYASSPVHIDRHLPTHLRGRKDYKVISGSWVPDGRYITANYYEKPKEIPTGSLILELEFAK